MSDESSRQQGSHPLPVIHDRGDMALRAWVQMARTYTKFQQKMAPVFERHGLTSPQFDVLATLHRGEGITQQVLAGRLLVTKGNVCGVLDRMEAAGLIERRADPDDRRANCLFLMAAGRERFAKVLPEHHALVQQTMAGFEPEELNIFFRLMKTFEEAIGD